MGDAAASGTADELALRETPAQVRALAAAWLQDPPPIAKRPELSELLHITTETDQSNWHKASVCSTYGPRPTNEDRHILECNWTTLPGHAGSEAPGAPAALFAVCDGHGGASVSSSVSRNLGILLRTELDAVRWSSEDSRKAAVRRAFIEMDGLLKREQNPVYSRCGCTCVVAAVWRGEDANAYQVLLANLGDSFGLLYRAEADVLVETVAHKPDQPCEKKRIRAVRHRPSQRQVIEKLEAGGFVMPADDPQPARIDGALAVSRAFGDFMYKGMDGKPLEEQKVSPMPDVHEFVAAAGDSLVLACDGLSDVCNSTEVAALTVLSLQSSPEPVEAAGTLVWAALQRDTTDNVTCLVVRLGEGE